MGENFREFCSFGEFAKVLTMKIFKEYWGVTINGRVISLDNGESVSIMTVASLSLARKYLSNRGISHCLDQ